MGDVLLPVDDCGTELGFCIIMIAEGFPPRGSKEDDLVKLPFPPVELEELKE